MTTINSRWEIRTKRNDTFKLEFYNVKENNQLLNMDGWFIRLVVRESPESKDPILEFYSAKGEDGNIDNTEIGKIVIYCGKTYMDIPARTYCYDLEVTRGDGIVETWISNKKFIVEEDIAR